MQFYEIVIKTKAGLAVDHISWLILGNKTCKRRCREAEKPSNGAMSFALASDIRLDRALPVLSQGKSGGVLKHLITQTANDLGDDEWVSGVILHVLRLKTLICRPTFATTSLLGLF